MEENRMGSRRTLKRGKGEKCPKCGYRVPKPFKSWVIGKTRVSAWACICGNRWRTARAKK